MFNSRERHSERSEESRSFTGFRMTISAGQTLVESILAIAVAIIVVTALVGVGVGSMRTANFGKNQAEAVRLATQTLEVLQSTRDAGWSGFYSQVTGCTAASPCCVVYSGSYQIVAHGPSCVVGAVDTSFWQTGYVVNDHVDITSQAEFFEGATKRDVTVQRTFSNWH